METIQRVTVSELRDFCTCPFLYEKKHVLKESPDRDRTTSHFDGHSHIIHEAEQAINSLVGFYFHRLMDHRQVRYETLYHRWEKIWWDDVSAEEIMNSVIPVKRASRVRINTHLLEHLPKFHKTFHKPFCPIAVEKDITLPTKSTILESNIQMAYRSGGKVRIVKFLPTRISPGDPAKDLSLITQACAWMNNNDEDHVEVAYYCMLSPKEYEPFTVGTITSGTIGTLTRVIQAFQEKEAISDIECRGCEYICKG
jgi:hypothetical protein